MVLKRFSETRVRSVEVRSSRARLVAVGGIVVLLAGLLAGCGPRPDRSTTLTISVPDENPEFTFSLDDGDQVYVDVTGFTVSSTSRLRLYAPSGQLVGSSYMADFDAGPVSVGGTYRLVLDGNGSTTGNANVTIRDANPFTQGTTNVGGQANLSITKPGFNPQWTIPIGDGDQVYVDVTGFTVSSTSRLRLYAPSGQLVGSSYMADFDAGPVSVGGNYRLVLDGNGSTTGNANVTIRDANPFTQGTTNVGGQANFTISDPGLNPQWTIPIGDGDQVYVDVTGFTVSSTSRLRLYAPSGQLVGSSYMADFDAGPVSVGGNYRLVLDGNGSTTGNANVTIRDANPFTQGTTAFGGQANFTIGQPGLNPQWTFPAVEGDRVRITVKSFTVSSTSRLRLYAPSGQLVGSSYMSDFDTGALSVGGTYRLVLDGNGATTGNAIVGVTRPK